jgi:signal transduction histidine kinase
MVRTKGTRAFRMDDLTRGQRLQECLFSVFDLLAMPVPLHEQLRRIHECLYAVMDASNLYVAVFHEPTQLYLFPYSADEDDDDVAPQRLEGSLTDYVRRTGEPLLCDVARHDALTAEGHVSMVGTPSPTWLGAPMKTSRGVIGVVVVQSYVDENAYGPEDVTALAMVARAMAHAVEGSMRRHTLEAEHQQRLHAMELSRDEALAASQAKSTFLATMSHELRTPLTAILGYAELLEEELLDAGWEGPEDLEKIQVASKHLLRVISDILDLSRIESDRVTVSLVPIRLRDLVESVRTLTAPLLTARGATMAIRCAEGTVTTDSGKLTQILTNLIGNAVNYGGRNISLRVGLEEQSLVAEVSDNGEGIPADQLERIFRAFEQGDASSTRRRDGAGLGLAICRGFARVLGGDCVAASVPGMGSTFTVELPLP